MSEITRSLAIAVIVRALRDALYMGKGAKERAYREEARIWLTCPDPSLRFWFDLAGIGPFTEEQINAISLRQLQSIMARLAAEREQDDKGMDREASEEA